jgi:hypothetical protein
MVFEAPEIEISSNAGDPSDIRNITGSVSLPTGASTLAEQVSQTTKLTSLDSKFNTLGQKTSAFSAPFVLASDQGKNVIPILSDYGLPIRPIPYEPETYVLFAEAVVLGNLKSMVSIVNSGTKILKIKSIKIINNQTTAITGVVAEFGLRRITGHSAGTTLTANSFDTADTLASVTTLTNSTVAGEGANLMRYKFSSDEWGVGTQDVEANDHIAQALHPVYYPQDKTKPLTLRQNQGFTIKCLTNTTAGSFDFEIIFTLEVA